MFIAKNKSNELQQDNEIKLYRLMEAGQDIDIKDIEPILAKLSYEGIKNLAGSEEKNEKERWKSIISLIQGMPNLSKFAEGSSILNFVTNVASKIFN